MRMLAPSLLFLAASAAGQTICIDPGHPSEVGPGTRGRRLTEMQAAWDVAVALRHELQGKGFRVILTKNSESEFVRNRRRAEIANNAHADLMLRLHCDASNGSGYAVYYPARTGTAEGVTGPSLTVLRRSTYAARRLHAAMVASLRNLLPDEGLKTDLQTAVGSRQGALTGSIFSKVPVVLVEMVVLTNPKDEAFMLSRSGSEAMVRALEAGVITATRR